LNPETLKVTSVSEDFFGEKEPEGGFASSLRCSFNRFAGGGGDDDMLDDESDTMGGKRKDGSKKKTQVGATHNGIKQDCLGLLHLILLCAGCTI
jgi:hypothetical protein